MNLRVRHALPHLTQPPAHIHRADSVGVHLRHGIGTALVHALPTRQITAVDDEMDDIVLDAVRRIAVFDDRIDDLMRRVILLDVLLGIGHALLRRELATIDVAVIGEEAENLVVHNRVPRGTHLAGLLIADMA